MTPDEFMPILGKIGGAFSALSTLFVIASIISTITHFMDYNGWWTVIYLLLAAIVLGLIGSVCLFVVKYN